MPTNYSISAVISAVDKFTDPMNKIAGKTIGDISRKMSSVGKGLTAGLTLPIVGIGIAAIHAATKMNEGMANVATLIPGNTTRVNELKTAVQDMAIETGKSTEDMVVGLFDVISAFGDTADTTEILGITARAATAGLSTTKEALTLLSAVTKGYGDSSAVAIQKTADLAFVTNKLGQTTFAELAGSIGDVVPLATELGVTQEEMFGVMATATGVTGNAAKVSTQFKGALQALMSPSASMAALFEALEIKSGAALIKQRGLKGALDLVAGAAKKAEVPIKDFIGSQEGQLLALTLTGAQSDVFAYKLGEMGKATGAAGEAFKEQTQGVNAAGFTMTQLSSKVSVISQRLGDGLAPVLNIVLDKLSPLIDIALDLATGFQTLDPGLQTVIVGIGGLAAVMGPALVVIGALLPLLAAITLPVLGVVAAITALAAVGVLLYTKWEPIKQFFADLWNGITGNITANVKNITQSIDAIMSKVDRFTSGISAVGKFLGIGGGETAPAPTSPATGSRGGPASALASALPAQPNNQVSGQIEVKFDNAPPGTRVQQTGSSRSAVDVVTDLGTNLMQWATGG